MYSLEQFCEVVKGTIIQRGISTSISTINIYPLEMFSGDVFVAINSSKYPTTDGGFGNTGNEDSVFGLKGTQNTYSYISNAIELGASTILIDDISSLNGRISGVNYVLVEDSVQALALIAKDILMKSNARIIGVSGSTGKTTLSKCLVNYISRKDKVFCLDCIRITYLGLIWSIIHDFNNSYNWIVLEMQTDGQGQLDRICEIVTLDYAFIVNIKDSHLERFTNIESLINEKLALYRGLSSEGYIFINYDDAILANWHSNQNDRRIISVGRDPESDFVLDYGNPADNCNLSISNKFNHSTTTAMINANSDKEFFCTGMLHAFSYFAFKNNSIYVCETNCFSDIVGRFQVFKGKNNSKIIVDSYNASYLSVIDGIERVSKLKMNRKILVLGSLLELSNKSEEIHKEIGKYLNRKNIFDYILFIGEATLYSMNELRNNETVIIGHVYSYERAMSLLNNIPFDENTVMYFKGSGAMRLELLAMNFI